MATIQYNSSTGAASYDSANSAVQTSSLACHNSGKYLCTFTGIVDCGCEEYPWPFDINGVVFECPHISANLFRSTYATTDDEFTVFVRCQNVNEFSIIASYWDFPAGDEREVFSTSAVGGHVYVTEPITNAFTAGMCCELGEGIVAIVTGYGGTATLTWVDV